MLNTQIQINLTTKFKSLRRAFNDSEKYICITAGRRSGKTFEAFDWIYHNFLTKQAKTALWIDTKHSNIDKYIERYCKPRLIELWALCSYHQQKKILKFPGGEYIDFGSAEKPQSLEGFQYDIVIINEAGIALKKSGLWDNTIFPMTKGNNKTRIIGTPKGQNKFFELARKYKHYHFTAYDSPYWTKVELENIKDNVPSEVWRQEYLAEFLEGAGTVFRNIQQCIKNISYSQPKPGTQYVMGIDLAKYQDYTVITVAEQKTNQVVYIDRFNQIDWNFQKTRIFNTWKQFNKPTTIIDSTGVGDPIFDDLKKNMYNIEGYKFTNQSKADLVQNLSVMMDQQKIHFYSHAELLQELEIFGYEISGSGNLRYNAPEGFHDDLTISLALTAFKLNNNQSFTFVSNY